MKANIKRMLDALENTGKEIVDMASYLREHFEEASRQIKHLEKEIENNGNNGRK